MNAIVDQLKNYCDCLPDMEGSTFEKNVAELISLISNLTCWTEKPCDTFLNSERVEIVDIEPFDPCSCDGGIVEFTPFYTPFVPESFKVALVTQKGVNEEVAALDPSDFAYSETFGVLRIDIRDYTRSIVCGCPENSKLVITYNAGYEQIPDCLLQLFCDLLQVVADKNTCDCSACQDCEKGGEGETVFHDDTAKNLDGYLKSLIESGYKKQLGLMSLCGQEKRYWGSVV